MTTQPPLFDEQALAEITPLLTPREQEVMQMVVHGMTYKAIADTFGISIKTVKKHIGRIKEKLAARSMAQAAWILRGKLENKNDDKRN